MAIYHLHAKIIQRSKGKNVVAAAAYRRAAELFDEKEQRMWNYSNKPDVVHSELAVPKDAPLWVQNLVELHSTQPSQAVGYLWNKVDAVEKRIDSQLAREIEFALPIELNLEQNIELARAFIQDQFCLRGMIADWNIHWDKGNPHVHVLLTMRGLIEEGFGKRMLEWNSKVLLHSFREKWAEYANYYLRLHEHSVSIDHRSYQDQGIDLIPTIHQGKAVTDMDRRGISTDIMREANSIRKENLARIAADPTVLFNKLSKQRDSFSGEEISQELGRYVNDKGKFSILEKGILSEALKLEEELQSQPILTTHDIATILKSIEHHESVFSERDLAKAVSSVTDNAAIFAKAVTQIKASPDLMFLGPGDDGRDRFTTRKMFNLENEIQHLADRMREQSHVKISNRNLTVILNQHQKRTGKELTGEQLNAVKHILRSNSVSCLVGRAGTGKSFSLGAAKAVWESAGLRVTGIALSGIAADGLIKDAGISSSTIESFNYAIEKGARNLNHHDVVVMDEAGMTDSVSMKKMLHAVWEARAKLVLVGDHAQIQPVGPGASFRALIERLGFAEIQTVYRQKAQWQREATVLFSAGRVADGLGFYESHQCIRMEKNIESATKRLVNDWVHLRATTQHELKEFLVIAHRNEDVNLLNSLLREKRVRNQEIHEGYFVHGKRGELKIAEGDRLLFLRNNKSLGVSNGRFATVKSIQTNKGKVTDFTVILDGTDKEIRINPNEYKDFDYGYAATVHKVQGMTVNYAFVLAGGLSWNRHLTYVALSRHRENGYLYADKETHRNQSTLVRHLGRLGIKDSLLDFPLAFAERRSVDTEGLYKLLPKHLAQRLKAWKDKVTDDIEQALHPARYARRCKERAEIELEGQKITKRREDARSVAAYVDANRDMGLAWQTLQTKLYSMGFDQMTYEKAAFALISGTEEYLAFQRAIRQRDEKAFYIMQEPSRYEKAISIYQLDLDKLNKQSQQHICYERVREYTTYNKQGVVVHRDRLAAEIIRNIKSHYPYLQNFEIDSREIKHYAIQHLRRQLFRSLTAKERNTFKIVERYQAAGQKIGVRWSAQNSSSKDIGKYAEFKGINELAFERDRLAYEILKDRDKYDKALDFYQIGLATPLFGEKPTEKQIQYAEKKWFKLQQAAARYELQNRVEQYRQAVFVGDTKKRLSIAHAIVENPKAHHGAVARMGRDASEIWRTIRRDAKLYEIHQQYSKLDLINRVGFITVASYMKAKTSHACAWREILESKKHMNIPEKQFYEVLGSHANRYTRERNELAATILENVPLHQAGLDYFGIKADEIENQAYAHQCKINVDHYATETHPLMRAREALNLISDPKSHHGFVLEKSFEWRQIYKDAKIAEREAFFRGLSPEEKNLHRLSDRYRRANRNAGKLYSKLKEQNSNNNLSAHNSKRIEQAFAKRNYLAWRLVNLAYTNEYESLTDFAKTYYLKLDKLLQQHAQHSESLMVIDRYQSAYQNVLKAVAEFHHDIDLSKNSAQHNLQKAFTGIEGLDYLRKSLRLDHSEKLQFALQVYGLSKESLAKQIQGITELKNHLNSFAELNQVEKNQKFEKPVSNIRNEFKDVNLDDQRVDIKRLLNDLNARVEKVTEHYLGKPKSKTSNIWRYGSNSGSLAVNIKGSKQGFWIDYQTGEKGDLLSLIRQAMGISGFKEVLVEAQRFLGGYSNYIAPQEIKCTQDSQKTDLDAHTHNKILIAKNIYQGTTSIKGTVAERYLRERRGILGELDNKTFRYHPHLKNWMTGDVCPALVVVARDETKQICGVQAIFLDAKTAKKAPLGHRVKLSRGLVGEGVLAHRGSLEGNIALAEGPETALSIASAHPDWNVFITFGTGNFGRVGLKTKAQSILICADNDGINSNTAKAVERASNYLSRNGVDVWLALPEKSDTQKKWDFNDALLNSGVDQVRKDLGKAILFKAGINQKIISQKIIDTLSSLSPKETLPNTVSLESELNHDIKSNDISSLLEQYVDMELHQTELVNGMHLNRVKNPQLSRELSAKATVHSKSIRDFASKAIQHPLVIAELKNTKDSKPPTLSQRGGFISIKARIKKGELSFEDRQILLSQLKNKALDQIRMQLQNRSRDGRSR